MKNKNDNNLFFTIEDFDYFETTLTNYFYLKKKEQNLLRDVFELEMKIDDMRNTPGVKYDKVTRTYNNTETPYINSVINEKVSLELKAKDMHERYVNLNRVNSIEKKLKSLKKEQYDVVISVCKNRKTISSIAKEKGVSKQYMSRYFKNALLHMMKINTN